MIFYSCGLQSSVSTVARKWLPFISGWVGTVATRSDMSLAERKKMCLSRVSLVCFPWCVVHVHLLHMSLHVQVLHMSFCLSYYTQSDHLWRWDDICWIFPVSSSSLVRGLHKILWNLFLGNRGRGVVEATTPMFYSLSTLLRQSELITQETGSAYTVTSKGYFCSA